MNDVVGECKWGVCGGVYEIGGDVDFECYFGGGIGVYYWCSIGGGLDGYVGYLYWVELSGKKLLEGCDE